MVGRIELVTEATSEVPGTVLSMYNDMQALREGLGNDCGAKRQWSTEFSANHNSNGRLEEVPLRDKIFTSKMRPLTKLTYTLWEVFMVHCQTILNISTSAQRLSDRTAEDTYMT